MRASQTTGQRVYSIYLSSDAYLHVPGAPLVTVFLSRDNSIFMFTDASKEGRGKTAPVAVDSSRVKAHQCLMAEVFLAVKHFKALPTKVDPFVATDNTTVLVYVKKQGDTCSTKMCALLCWIISYRHLLYIYVYSIRSKHISVCPNDIPDPLVPIDRVVSAPTGVRKAVPQVVHTKSEPVWCMIQLQASLVCLCNPRSGVGVGQAWWLYPTPPKTLSIIKDLSLRRSVIQSVIQPVFTLAKVGSVIAMITDASNQSNNIQCI